MNELAEMVESLQNLLINVSTGGSSDGREYKWLRREIVNHFLLKDIAPRFLRTCRSSGEFWQYIKEKYPSYAERRKYIWEEFKPLFDRIEGSKATPSDVSIAEALERFDAETVNQLWLRAMERREADPEGAITLARSLLETVCKHILDESNTVYETDTDLPALYKTAAKLLNVAPSQHSEQIFKQILGGCTAVVEGLGALRNRLSDAHGQGKRPVRPAPRHAELAVNLAGAVSLFLVSTHQCRATKTST